MLATTEPARTPRLSLPLNECDSVSPGEWCALNRVGRTTLYKLWKEGKGPEFFMVGSRRRIPRGARPCQGVAA